MNNKKKGIDIIKIMYLLKRGPESIKETINIWETGIRNKRK